VRLQAAANEFDNIIVPDLELEHYLIDKFIDFVLVLLLALWHHMLYHLPPVACHLGRHRAFNCNKLGWGTIDATLVDIAEIPSSKAFSVTPCDLIYLPFVVYGYAIGRQYFTTIFVEKFPLISSLK